MAKKDTWVVFFRIDIAGKEWNKMPDDFSSRTVARREAHGFRKYLREQKDKGELCVIQNPKGFPKKPGRPLRCDTYLKI